VLTHKWRFHGSSLLILLVRFSFVVDFGADNKGIFYAVDFSADNKGIFYVVDFSAGVHASFTYR